jgi:hypothetical protein
MIGALLQFIHLIIIIGLHKNDSPVVALVSCLYYSKFYGAMQGTFGIFFEFFDKKRNKAFLFFRKCGILIGKKKM